MESAYKRFQGLLTFVQQPPPVSRSSADMVHQLHQYSLSSMAPSFLTPTGSAHKLFFFFYLKALLTLLVACWSDLDKKSTWEHDTEIEPFPLHHSLPSCTFYIYFAETCLMNPFVVV